MHYRPTHTRRSGAVVIECAIIYPVIFMMTIGLVVGGLGVYRYNELAHLSHSCARYASVHGGGYSSENKVAISAGTLPSVDLAYLQNYVKNQAILLDKTKLTVSVNMITSAGSNPWSLTNNGVVTGGNADVVSVTVTYVWVPEVAYFTGPITMSHTAVLPMSY
ncbi:MAG: hypothetical protein K2R98_11305 [Gemmataceae bacterium]|nr:hypothetical protein [Gemmataceae bacterium]